ncbi:mucin-5B-like [Physella acuta]|uniref:mucin-5B-like n=1 Tax=Physella acuta TaxID=109671 RepID=UPI0027DDF96D|nr:mucin-5B-like [Physella acuta]
MCLCGRGHIFKERKKCLDIQQCNFSTHHLVPAEDNCCQVDCVPKDECRLQKTTPDFLTINNCISVKKWPKEYCAGTCSVKPQFMNYEEKHLDKQECLCCSGHVKRLRAVEFKCDNSLVVTHKLPFIESCSCKSCTDENTPSSR